MKRILFSDSKNGFTFFSNANSILDMDGSMKYSKDLGKNWHLRFRLIIQELTEELELTQVQLQIAERKLKKYEDDNTRTTRNRKNNNSS